MAQSTGRFPVHLVQRNVTNLYNQRPAWLAIAHRKLDNAVLAAYGWPDDLSDEDILTRLLLLNRERTARAATATSLGKDGG